LFLFLSAQLVEDVGEMASSAVLTVEMRGHEDAGAAVLVGALTTKTGDFTVLINLVVLEDGKLDLLFLVLDLLGGSEGLLLALFPATPEAQDQMESGLFLDVIVGESSSIFQLLSGENQPLLIGRDAFLILNLS